MACGTTFLRDGRRRDSREKLPRFSVRAPAGRLVVQRGVVQLVPQRGCWLPTEIVFEATLGETHPDVRDVGTFGEHGRRPRLNHDLCELFPLTGIEAALAVKGEIAERGVPNRYGPAAVERHEDLGVLHALAAELGMNLSRVLPDDPVERGNGETCERTVIADDVVARPDTHL